MKQITNKTERMLEWEEIIGKSIEDVLRDLYVDGNMTVREIARLLSISYATCHKWLDMAGIKSRRINFEEVKE